MCNCNPEGIMQFARECNECQKRAAAGPNYNPLRGTDRTSDAVKAAVFAAAFGRRVAFICNTQRAAEYACRLAADFVAKSLKELVVNRVSCTKDKITFYFSNGCVAGIILFRDMGVEEIINRGLRTPEHYQIIRDHPVDEILAERAAQEQRQADSNTIKLLMRKHGWQEVQDILGQQNVGRKCDQNKLVFRT